MTDGTGESVGARKRLVIPAGSRVEASNLSVPSLVTLENVVGADATGAPSDTRLEGPLDSVVVGVGALAEDEGVRNCCDEDGVARPAPLVVEVASAAAEEAVGVEEVAGAPAPPPSPGRLKSGSKRPAILWELKERIR